MLQPCKESFFCCSVVERECSLHLCMFAELKELTNSLTTEELLSEIQELKAECSGYRARLETIKSATNHVTPEEREKVGDICNQAAILQTCSFLFKYFDFSGVQRAGGICEGVEKEKEIGNSEILKNGHNPKS